MVKPPHIFDPCFTFWRPEQSQVLTSKSPAPISDSFSPASSQLILFTQGQGYHRISTHGWLIPISELQRENGMNPATLLTLRATNHSCLPSQLASLLLWGGKIKNTRNIKSTTDVQNLFCTFKTVICLHQQGSSPPSSLKRWQLSVHRVNPCATIPPP